MRIKKEVKSLQEMLDAKNKMLRAILAENKILETKECMVNFCTLITMWY